MTLKKKTAGEIVKNWPYQTDHEGFLNVCDWWDILADCYQYARAENNQDAIIK